MAGSLHELFAAHRLTPAQRRIATYVMAHADQATHLTNAELAEQAGVSQPSVTRFVTRLGFERYTAFRRHLRSVTDTSQRAEDAQGTKFQKGIDEDVRNLAALRGRCADEKQLRSLGNRLIDSKPLVVLGFRVSAPPAALFGYLAAKIHPDVRVLPGGSVLGDQLRHARDSGARAAILFALPRYPREARDALRQARGLGLHVVLVTDKPVSVLSPEADEVITAEVASEFVFDSHGTVMSLSAALLEALTDAAGADGQQRLEDFEEFAAQQEIFLDE